MHGLGVEAEGRSLIFGGPQPNPPGPTGNTTTGEITYGGGAIYEWRHFKNFTPYGKLLWEQGIADFNVDVPHYSRDNRSVLAPGAGVEYRITRHIVIRADYEKQWWQRLFQNHQISTPTGIAIEPRGVARGRVLPVQPHSSEAGRKERLNFGSPSASPAAHHPAPELQLERQITCHHVLNCTCTLHQRTDFPRWESGSFDGGAPCIGNSFWRHSLLPPLFPSLLKIVRTPYLARCR